MFISFCVFLLIFSISTLFGPINGQEGEIVFPARVLQRDSQKSIDFLSISKDSVDELSRAAEAFSLEFFQQLARLEAGSNNNNIITSPFSIWSLLLILAEGAVGKTHDQLSTILRLPNDITKIRSVYKYLQHAFTKENSAIELIADQILFSDVNRPIDIDFENVIEHTYEADYFAVNFQRPSETIRTINDYVSRKVKGKINDVIDTSVLNEAQMVLISVLFFQGQWKEPFVSSETTDQPFYNENGEKIANVPTMFRKGGCTHIPMPQLGADIIELAYGFDRKYSMIILLPRKKTSLIRMIDNLRIFGLNHVIQNLDKTEVDPDLELFLPRFSIKSDYNLNGILQQMGLTDIFDANKANLSKISQNPIHVSQFKQKSIIEVNEKGTTAVSITSAVLTFQSLPAQFQVNRPFAFLIIERTTNSILFCGQVKNPLA